MRQRAGNWIVLLLANLYLASPVVHDLGLTASDGRGIDKISLFAVPASVLWLALVQCLFRRQWLAHAVLFPFYVATAFDLFLEQHPEFRERVTFIAHMMPSRQDVPEYVEYLERIEALVAVVNHRHGTTDWMPIDLKLRENLDEAIAAYKHYDLLMVNAMFDGMNLVAKEGPLVNERMGVSLLSENTGAHEELADFALSVNPFDVQEQADAIFRALTMSAEERSWRAQGLKEIIAARNPGDWVDDQLADIERKRAGAPAAR